MTILRILSSAGALLLLAGASHAQTPADPNSASVRSGNYVVEPHHTRVLFSVSHFGFSTWYGDFTHASGSLVLDPRHPSAAHLDVTVPIDSVSTTNSKLDGELKGADWFDATRFPTSRFISRSVVTTGAGKADVAGDLTLHGITRPVVLHVSFNGAGINPLDKTYTVGFEARGMISRTAFGITKYVPLVSDRVELILSGAFVSDADQSK